MPEEFARFPTWLDNKYAVLDIPSDNILRGIPLWQCAQHLSLGVARQNFAGISERDSQQRGEFTLCRYIQVLHLPQGGQVEITLNDLKNDSIPLVWVGQAYRHTWITKIYVNNLVAVPNDFARLLLKGGKFPQK